MWVYTKDTYSSFDLINAQNKVFNVEFSVKSNYEAKNAVIDVWNRIGTHQLIST